MYFDKLFILKKKGLLREVKDRLTAQGPHIQLNGKEYVNFSSNDYLGLSNHPYVINKVKEIVDSYGYGSSASRLLSGGCVLHKILEEKIAQFKESECALIFNSGYDANTGIIPAIADENDVILSDELNHASIIDGCRLSKAQVRIYKHKDVSHLEDLIKSEHAKKKIVITDTIFSMDGDITPLQDIYSICSKNNAILYIDDAHGTGVLGKGKGALSHFHIKPEPWIIQMGTFSKAFGSFGAFVAGSKEFISWILNTARSFIFSTALPSVIVAASLASLEIIENNPDLVKKLWANRERVANSIKNTGFDIMGSETPIIPLRTGNLDNTIRISRLLFENGIYAPAIRPPTVKEARIRITVTAGHSEQDIERLTEVLRKV